MRLILTDSHCKCLSKFVVQKHIQNPVKPIRWSVLQRYLAANSRWLFGQNAPSYMFDRILDKIIRWEK